MVLSMANHKVTIARGNEMAFQARCRCRNQSNVFQFQWEAEDWERGHLALVERVKAYLGGKNPSLKNQRDWYFLMESGPDIPEKERELWHQLRTELDRRLNAYSAEEQSMFEFDL